MTSSLLITAIKLVEERGIVTVSVTELWQNFPMKEKHLWAICLVVLIGGFAVGNIDFGHKFFEVQSIQDLFEIFSSAATVFAVFIAWRGINAWRRQASGQADLELARRLAVGALAVKESAVPAWVDAKFSINQFPFGAQSLNPPLMESIRVSMGARIKSREQSRLEFGALLQEAKAIWGSAFTDKYNQLIELCVICDRCAQDFISWADPNVGPNVYLKHQMNMQQAEDYLRDSNCLDAEGEIGKIIKKMTEDADAELERHMLRK